MAVQRATTITNKPFILDGPGQMRRVTVTQDGGRTDDLAFGTVCSRNPSTDKWVPLTNIAATNGTQNPKGIIMQTIATADLVAGDVEDVAMLLSDALIDEEQVVLENSLTLASVITVPTNVATDVRDALRANCNITFADTVDTTEIV
jgi:hypothetical protein